VKDLFLFIGGYVLVLGLFRLLGGWGAAGETLQRWGRASAALRRSAGSPSS
jgi:hypothetical protein